jgi:hypothetical protein
VSHYRYDWRWTGDTNGTRHQLGNAEKNIWWFLVDPRLLVEMQWLQVYQLYITWLVVWNMNLFFPYIGKNNPNWPTHIFRGVETTNQTIYYHHTICCAIPPVSSSTKKSYLGWQPPQASWVKRKTAVVSPQKGAWTKVSPPKQDGFQGLRWANSGGWLVLFQWECSYI